MNRVKRAFAVLSACVVTGLSAPVSAITAGELLADNSSGEVYSYLAGLADMLAYSEYIRGNEDRGNCIYNWYYRTEGSVENIYQTLQKHRDSQPEAIMIVLAKRPCPLPE